MKKFELPYPGDSYWPSGRKPMLHVEDDERGLVTLYLDHEGERAVLLAMSAPEAEALSHALRDCAREVLG